LRFVAPTPPVDRVDAFVGRPDVPASTTAIDGFMSQNSSEVDADMDSFTRSVANASRSAANASSVHSSFAEVDDALTPSLDDDLLDLLATRSWHV
jgi:hypothetical protein